MKVKSACLTGVDKIELRERELDLKEDEVLVKTHLAGICGSDKNLYRGVTKKAGGLDTEMRKPFLYPFFFGHEGGGEVVEVGEKVTQLKVGQKVIAFAWIDTFSDYFVAKPEDLEVVPAGLDMNLACLGEPISCAMFSGMNSNVQFGDTVAIIGMGFAGQIIAQVCKGKGAHKVIGVDLAEEKLSLARELGADLTVNSSETDPLEYIMEQTGGKGADVVVEAAGSAESVNLSTSAVRHNGTLVFYSWITNDITINISRWHNNSLKILNTGLVHHSIQERMLWTPMALRPVIQGQVSIEPLITHRFPLEQIDEAFALTSASEKAVKVAIEID